MYSLNLLKFVIVLIALTVSSCQSCQTKSDLTNVMLTPNVATEIKSEIPFSTKEPENFQAEISVTTDGIEDKTFTARNQANQLTIFDFQKPTEIALLKIGANQKFLINNRQKIYVENEAATNVSDVKSDSLKSFLTAEWLNQKSDAKFENLGAENNLAKYLVRLNDSLNSEIIVSVDEQINLPVKQEFYTKNGEQKVLTLTAELKNFSLQPEAKLFEVPKDYRKVSLKEFQEKLRDEKLKKND